MLFITAIKKKFKCYEIKKNTPGNIVVKIGSFEYKKISRWLTIIPFFKTL